ncbi:hypothetical protein CP557_17090 [Natrinema ejinorense]|uniref:Uncharacterized protein n=1 Tax=Natrinema ejinorense TaxID=373386 RepID=A0A2A5QYZ8_9EURY|nr:hypothetical protein CP557_17090 [Natrinema ejinorense]
MHVHRAEPVSVRVGVSIDQRATSVVGSTPAERLPEVETVLEYSLGSCSRTWRSSTLTVGVTISASHRPNPFVSDGDRVMSSRLTIELALLCDGGLTGSIDPPPSFRVKRIERHVTEPIAVFAVSVRSRKQLTRIYEAASPLRALPRGSRDQGSLVITKRLRRFERRCSARRPSRVS